MFIVETLRFIPRWPVPSGSEAKKVIRVLSCLCLLGCASRIGWAAEIGQVGVQGMDFRVGYCDGDTTDIKNVWNCKESAGNTTHGVYTVTSNKHGTLHNFRFSDDRQDVAPSERYALVFTILGFDESAPGNYHISYAPETHTFDNSLRSEKTSRNYAAFRRGTSHVYDSRSPEFSQLTSPELLVSGAVSIEETAENGDVVGIFNFILSFGLRNNEGKNAPLQCAKTAADSCIIKSVNVTGKFGAKRKPYKDPAANEHAKATAKEYQYALDRYTDDGHLKKTNNNDGESDSENLIDKGKRKLEMLKIPGLKW